MRIAVGGIEHETNTYCSAQTPLSDFYVIEGDRLLATAGQETACGGAMDACAEFGLTVVPILHAMAQPSGTIQRTAYDELKDRFLTRLAESGPYDGVLLTLHGAGVVDGIHDLEGDLVRSVREVVGPRAPIVATFDLHGNITEEMVAGLQGVFACHHYPHIDMHHRARDAIQLLMAIHDGAQVANAAVILPALQPMTTTFEGVGQEVIEYFEAMQTEREVEFISWFHGFPYADVPHVGNSIVVTSTKGKAESVAREMATYLWQRREDFRCHTPDGPEAVAAAQARVNEGLNGPVVIHEISDNTGGGAPGDGTHLLRAMLDAQLGADACFGFVVDAEVAKQAHSAGVGSVIEISLGGKTDDLHGAPIVAPAYVKALADGRLVLQHMFKGAPLNIGPIARLQIEGIDVVVASRRSQTFDREPFLAVGIDVLRYKYVALKSTQHFRAGFQHIAGAIVAADTPGLVTQHIERFPRQNTSRALWPLDERVEFRA